MVRRMRPPMLNFRLSLMMFLQFFIWGSWYVTVGNYMAASGSSGIIHWAYSVGPISALISPFFVGIIADRFFPTQRILGILFLVGSLAMGGATWVGAENPGLFIVFLFLHTLCYFPTLGLTSTLTFHQIKNPEKEFPVIRVFGSIGWISANILVSAVLQSDATVLPLQVAGVTCLFMGIYCFTLPHTPPRTQEGPRSWKSILGWDAFQLLRNRPFAVFIACELLISIPLSTYYSYAPVFLKDFGLAQPAFHMSFGQMSEVVLMFFMPWVLIRAGVKNMIVIGFTAWVCRFLLLGLAAKTGMYPLLLMGILLHGICFDFVYIAGQIFVDQVAGKDLRGQAQGMLVLLRSGIGLLTGAQLSGWMYNSLVAGSSQMTLSWSYFWLIPGLTAVVILVWFAMQFPQRPRMEE